MELYSKTFKHVSSSEWVVFIHGAGGSTSIWYKQLKAFKEEFNVLLLDLRGHGNSKVTRTFKPYTFDLIINDVIELLDHKGIEKAHFVGISLGSMISKLIAIRYPKRVRSLVLGGSILNLNLKSKTLLLIGNFFKRIVPYMWLYRVFASIILPQKNHSQSRRLFIREAAKMDQIEFLKWFRLTKELPKTLNMVRNIQPKIPTLFIQGQEDYMFLKEILQSVNFKKAKLHVIPACGHVVNVEKPNIFNELSISFLKDVIARKHQKTEPSLQ